MDREKVIVSQNEKKKKVKKKILPSIDPRPAKSYSAASGRFSHSGSHIDISKYRYTTTPQHHKLASLAHHYCHSGCMASHTLHAQLVWPADGWCASAPDQSICFEIVTASGNGIFHLQCTRG